MSSSPIAANTPFEICESYPLQDDVADQAWSHPDDAAYDNYDSEVQKA